MVLYLIGLGLGDEKDITVKGIVHTFDSHLFVATGLEAVRKCTRVYLEAYTAVLGIDKAKLVTPLYLLYHNIVAQEEFYGISGIVEADREMGPLCTSRAVHRVLLCCVAVRAVCAVAVLVPCTVESNAGVILDGADTHDVGFLVVGDALA